MKKIMFTDRHIASEAYKLMSEYKQKDSAPSVDWFACALEARYPSVEDSAGEILMLGGLKKLAEKANKLLEEMGDDVPLGESSHENDVEDAVDVVWGNDVRDFFSRYGKQLAEVGGWENSLHHYDDVLAMLDEI